MNNDDETSCFVCGDTCLESELVGDICKKCEQNFFQDAVIKDDD